MHITRFLLPGRARCLLFALLCMKCGDLVCHAWEQNRERHGQMKLEYLGRQALPNFEIGGRIARIHTQGLFVTDRHYYVTGRLQRNPRRPLLVRFDRSNLSVVEHVDLLAARGVAAGDASLDHPGGFDFDGESFWIPLAVGRPNSTSLLVRFHPQAERPLAELRLEAAFRVGDHIGAVACDRAAGRLYGANWDAKFIYVWKPDGTLVEKIAQTDLLPANADRALAVQDWKGIGDQGILAGAVDKNPRLRPAESKAVLQWIDVRSKREVHTVRLTSPPQRQVVPTQEGMAVFHNEVFFLPADLGANAEVFRYRWLQRPEWMP